MALNIFFPQDIIRPVEASKEHVGDARVLRTEVGDLIFIGAARLPIDLKEGRGSLVVLVRSVRREMGRTVQSYMLHPGDVVEMI